MPSLDSQIELPVHQWGQGFLENIPLSKSKKLLDVGCRRGKLTSTIAKQFPLIEITAIDNEGSEISEARSTHRLANLQFEKLDALDLDFHERFDTVISLNCLHWIQDKTRALKNIYKCLKPGGKAYLQFFAYHGRQKNDYFLYQAPLGHSWKSHLRGFSQKYHEITPAKFCNLVHSSGFVLNKMEFVTYQSPFRNGYDLHQWYSTWCTQKDYIPKRKIDHFLNESTQLYLKAHNYQYNKAFTFNEHLLEIQLEKPLIGSTQWGENQTQYGSHFFTKRETFVLKHFLRGKSAKEISSLTHVSPKTIEFHLCQIRNKLNCHSRSEVFEAALSRGFMDLIFEDSL